MADNPKVRMVWPDTGRVMEASRSAFDRQYAAAGWQLAPEQPKPAEEPAEPEPVDEPAEEPAKRTARAKK